VSASSVPPSYGRSAPEDQAGSGIASFHSFLLAKLQRIPLLEVLVELRSKVMIAHSPILKPESGHGIIFKPYTELDCSNQKQQNCSRALLLNCKPNLTRNFSKSYTSFSLRIGTATAKHGNAGKSRFRRATYDFLLQI
jgi:hypothetical protein